MHSPVWPKTTGKGICCWFVYKRIAMVTHQEIIWQCWIFLNGTGCPLQHHCPELPLLHHRLSVDIVMVIFLWYWYSNDTSNCNAIAPKILSAAYHSPVVSNSGPSTDYFHKNCRVSHKTNIRETKFYKLWYPIFLSW